MTWAGAIWAHQLIKLFTRLGRCRGHIDSTPLQITAMIAKQHNYSNAQYSYATCLDL